jgi:prophage regulatory protein
VQHINQPFEVSVSEPTDRLIGEKECCAITSLSRMKARRLIRDGKFPGPVQLSAGRIAWRESEIQAWIAALPRVPEPVGEAA